MKKSSSALLARPYERLRRTLAAVGYISQGSVLDRSTLRPPRHGYQWTRKVAGKTITLALNREQFEALGQAIQNHRQLRQTIGKMETLSRRVLFGKLPDTRRRKPLNKKVLGVI
jgi:hypothetical protein